MAVPDSSKVLVGKPKVTGGVLAGPTGGTLPTDAKTAANVSYVGLGYASDAGLVQTIGRDTSSIKAWGGDEVRVVTTGHTVSYSVSLIETSAATLGEVYGIANVSTASGLTTVKINAAANGRRTYVFDMLDGTTNIRVVVPFGEITEVGDVTFVDGEPISYDLTINAYPDAQGNKAYLYMEQSA